MSSRSRALKPSGIALLLLLLTLVAIALFGLRSAQKKAENMIVERVTARGWGLELEDSKVRFSGKVQVGRLCISLADDAHNDLCVENLTVRLRRLALLRRRIQVRDVDAETVRVDSSRARLSRLRGEERDEASEDKRKTSARIPTLRDVKVQQLDLRLTAAHSFLGDGDASDSGPPKHLLELQLQDLVVKNKAAEASMHARGNLHVFESADRVVEQSVGTLIEKPFSIEVQGSLSDGIQHAALLFEEPFAGAIQLRDRIDVGFESLQFEAPYALRVNKPTFTIEARALRLAADWVETHVGVWTTDLPQFYLTSLTASAPTLELPHDQTRIVIGRVNEMIGGRREASPQPDTDTPDQDDVHAVQHSDADEDQIAPDAPPQVPQHAKRTLPSSSIPGLIHTLFEERNWWEILPRAIEFQDGTVRLIGKTDAETMRIQDLHVQYGVRVLHQQMDLEFAGNLVRQDDEAGEVDVRLEWDYSRKIGRAFWDIERLSLDSLALLIGELPVDQLSGVFESEGRLRVDRQKRITGAHRTTLDDLHVAHSRLDAPFEVQHFSIAGDIGHGEPEEGESPSLIFKQQAIALEDTRATLELELRDFEALGRPRTSSARIDFRVPDQPAMQLFASIPASIRGPVSDAEMSGSWGLRLAFSVDHMGMTDDGKPLWNITAPSIYELRDRGLRLISLPKDVDVRRLNGAMDFVFRGPGDGFMRPLHIPSPKVVEKIQRENEQKKQRTNDSAPVGAEADDSARRQRPSDPTEHAWTPLRDMSYYFIATQLYREDGSFFRNSGINWLQIRRVLSDALTHGRVQRGASTITMQTVKNIFLTHEQSAERKIQELFLSYWLTRAVPKERILEIYLNILELAPQRNGANEASLFHFDTPIGDLGIRESIWLSAISPNPTAMGGTRPKERLPHGSCARCDQILRALHARDWINDEEYAAAMEDPSAPERDDLDGIPAAQRADQGLVLDDPGGWFSGRLLDIAHEPDEETSPADARAADESTAQAPSPHPSDTPPADAPLLQQLDEDHASTTDSEPLDATDTSVTDFELLPVDERLDAWIDTSRPVRGTR